MTAIDRRLLLGGVLAMPLLRARAALAREPIYIADMHFHLFFLGRKPASTQPLAPNMASGGATLVSWSLVGDVPWLRPVAGGFRPFGRPAKREAADWLAAEMKRVRAHLAEQKLPIVVTAAEVDRAVRGEPHVVLSVEGATFADNDVAALQAAYDMGIRHIQLVHFLDNRIADIQTERPSHGGMTEYGRRVIRECNRLGMLVDLAHCTSEVVQQALEVAEKPLVWSHSSVNPNGPGNWQLPGWRARQLSLADAKAIAAKGGVVGLWALGNDVGRSADGYAARIISMIELLGEDHVGFGTDMNALATPAISNFADLRRVVETLERRGLPEQQIRKIAIENYARVLRLAFQQQPA